MVTVVVEIMVDIEFFVSLLFSFTFLFQKKINIIIIEYYRSSIVIVYNHGRRITLLINVTADNVMWHVFPLELSSISCDTTHFFSNFHFL